MRHAAFVCLAALTHCYAALRLVQWQRRLKLATCNAAAACVHVVLGIQLCAVNWHCEVTVQEYNASATYCYVCASSGCSRPALQIHTSEGDDDNSQRDKSVGASNRWQTPYSGTAAMGAMLYSSPSVRHVRVRNKFKTNVMFSKVHRSSIT